MNTAQTMITAEATDKDGISSASSPPSLGGWGEQAMENYFQNLFFFTERTAYDMVMTEVEAPLLEIVLKYTRHNQTKAAQVLGLNRGTLRKKLKQYGLL